MSLEKTRQCKSPFDILMLYAGIAVALRALAAGYSLLEEDFKSIAWLTFGLFGVLIFVGLMYPPLIETTRDVKRLRTAAGCTLFGIAVLIPVVVSQGGLFASFHHAAAHMSSHVHAHPGVRRTH